MNPIAEEIKSYYGCASDEEILEHYGIKRRSGRYPWGSGEDPYQHSGDFLSRVENLRKSGMSEAEIAKSLDLTTTELRAYKAIAKNERRALQVATAKSLREDGLSLNEIAAKMGFNNDSSVRSLLNEASEKNMNQAQLIAKDLKSIIDKKGMIDVGEGVEREFGASKEKFNQALAILEAEGYPVYGGGVPQATNPGKQTILKVICPPGTEHKEIYEYDKIHSAREYGLDDIEIGEESRQGFKYPASMDSRRLLVRHVDDKDPRGFTGEEKDGTIELRRGVEDLDLGNARYAQVRILVDGTHFIKGMAYYSDDIPDGYDVVFNSNKPKDMPIMGTEKNNSILKPIKKDPENPFGSAIKEEGGQSYYIDKNGKKKLSLINKRADEGDWERWEDALPSQFLSKQPLSLIKKQLDLTKADAYAEFDSIMEVNNPTVKKRLLRSFADDCDAAAVHLKAAALPRQQYHVLFPMNVMGDNEVYAPNYKNGEQVALIRYPHAGTFEIPILTVNNKKQAAKRILGNSTDAIGINFNVASQLSGADFDGDAAVVIPLSSKIKIKATKQLKDLKGFNPSAAYPAVEGMRVMNKAYAQKQMGIISNLITDMTLKGATPDELARAVKHSMVVIDAEKHKLNYKQSEIDNNIAALKKKYQSYTDENGKEHVGGASTLISRAKSPVQTLKRKGSPIIDPKTGEQSFKEVVETYVDKNGKTQTRMIDVPKMSTVKDARELSSGTPQEELYADYANSMKALANKARKEMLSTGNIKYSASAKEVYKEEVASLMSKLNLSEQNKPKERLAQLKSNAVVKAKKQDNPDMTKEEKTKAATQALTKARLAVGAKRVEINISDREWEAIQAGAISENQLSKILDRADLTELRQRATPRNTKTLSQAKINKAKSMSASGFTNAEIAESLGVSPSTIIKYLRGKE